MKKIALALAFSAAFVFGNAQDGNNICVWNAMNNFNGGLKCSDEAAVNESTSGKAKTWFYRGEIYTLAFQDTSLRKKLGTSGFEAVKAFKKLVDINDPKFKEWDDVFKYIAPLATNIFNEGEEQFQAKNFAQAFQYFYAIKDIDAVYTAKGKKGGIDLTTALKNASICAENSGDMNNAIKVYQDWIAIAPNAAAYRNYGLALKKTGKADEAKKVIDEGLSKFGTDANLLVEKINFYLENAQYTDALGFVNKLLDVEPKNDGAVFIKGLAYEKIGNEDSVVYYYTKAADMNPKNIKPLNNLGALYVNKANAYVEEMNKLGTSNADLKKYEELKKMRKELYLKAKPFLEKAKAIEPNDAQINRTLKQIESYTAE
jgi:tetratricopeptide (TPR) repeat protein